MTFEKELRNSCSEEFKLPHPNLFFVNRVPIKIKSETETEFLSLVDKYNPDFPKKVPKYKLGVEVAANVLERLSKKISGSATELNIQFLNEYISRSAKDFVSGIKHKIESSIISAICGRSLNNSGEVIPATPIETSTYNSLAELKSAVEHARKAKNYNNLFVRSGLAKELFDLKDGEVSEYVKSQADINIIIIDSSFWYKTNGGTKHKAYHLLDTEVILANIGVNPEETECIEFSCEHSLESKLCALKNYELGDDPIFTYLDISLNPPTFEKIDAFSVVNGFVNITKPENFRVFKLADAK